MTVHDEGVWIWDAFHRETPNQLMLFRRTVELAAPAVDGALEVAARGSFRVWVNGTMVAHHDLHSAAPGAESLRVDLAPCLAGATTSRFEVVVGVYLLGIGTHHQPRALGGLFVTGSVREVSGTVHRLDSSTAWTTCVPSFWRQNTPQMVWSAGFTEWWDHTTLAGDSAGAVARGSWTAAVVYPDGTRPTPYRREVTETTVDLAPFRIEHGVVHAAAGPFDSRAAECVAVGAGRTAAPVGGAADADGRYDLFLLANQVVGFIEVDVGTDEPCVVDVIAGEALDEHGWPTATRQGIQAIDTITIPPGTTTHRFWHRRTFRALAIIMRTGATASLRRATVHTVTAARPPAEFHCGIDQYDRIFDISVATAAVGRQDLYEDCPLREAGHYVADARIQALFDLVSTGASSLARRSILQFASAQDPDGMIPALSPSGTHHRIPDFSLQWVSYVDDYVRFTGDNDLLRRVTPALVRSMEWADARWDTAVRHFAVDEPGWWPFIDWYGFDADALQAAVDAQYLVAVHAAAVLAERAGDPCRAARRRDRLTALLAGLPEPIASPHAATILLCGLPAELARPRVAPGALRGFVADTGYWNFWVCLAYLALDDPSAAWELLRDYWGGMLDAGAGTWWERYAPDREVTSSTDASLCHPWSAGPVVLLPMLLSGVNPFAREKSRMRFEPIDIGGSVTMRMHTPCAWIPD